MLEILKNFEQIAGRLNSAMLVLPGVLLVGLGLVTWLGGLGFRRPVLGLVGVFLGGGIVLAITPAHAPLAVLAAFLTGLIGLLFQRLFAAVLLGMLTFAVAFTIAAWPGLQAGHGSSLATTDVGRSEGKLTIAESRDVIRTTLLDMADRIRSAARTLRPLHWAIATAAGAGLVALGVLFHRFGAAVACAVLGTAMIVAGLVVLIMQKGSTPVARMESRAAFYGLVFAGMAAFGTLEQLVLCGRVEQKQQARRKSKKASRKKDSKEGWRNR
jgi:hypothetical protein